MDGTQPIDTAGIAGAAHSPDSGAAPAEFQWVVRVDLPEVTGFEQAERWMDVVSDAVYGHDDGFIGVISVTRESAGLSSSISATKATSSKKEASDIRGSRPSYFSETERSSKIFSQRISPSSVPSFK